MIARDALESWSLVGSSAGSSEDRNADRNADSTTVIMKFQMGKWTLLALD
jgi:hypothetical protein